MLSKNLFDLLLQAIGRTVIIKIKRFSLVNWRSFNCNNKENITILHATERTMYTTFRFFVVFPTLKICCSECGVDFS